MYILYKYSYWNKKTFINVNSAITKRPISIFKLLTIEIEYKRIRPMQNKPCLRENRKILSWTLFFLGRT